MIRRNFLKVPNYLIYIPYDKGTMLQSLIDEVYLITRCIMLKKMITDEYLTVKQISKEYQVTTRYIRKIITSLINETSENLLYKDPTQKWLIHRLLLPKFKPKRSKVPKYYALSIDPVAQYTETEIDVIMKFVLDNMGNDNIEVCYTIEKKKANGRNHVHCYVNCLQRKKLIEQVRLGFSSVSYHQQDIYDLQGWKNYITKDGTAIKTIKN